MRKLIDIHKEIETEKIKYKETINKLNKEIEEFQNKCPHPEALIKHIRDSTEDEYGAIEEYCLISECLCCGYSRSILVSPSQLYQTEYPKLNESTNLQ